MYGEKYVSAKVRHEWFEVDDLGQLTVILQSTGSPQSAVSVNCATQVGWVAESSNLVEVM